MFVNELVQRIVLSAGHGVYLAVDGVWRSTLEIDCMVPRLSGGKSLRLFFTKYRSIPLVYFWEFHFHGFGLGLYGQLCSDASVGAFFFQLGDNRSSFLLIFLSLYWSDAPAYYGKVLWVESAFFPFETRLEGGQPWIA